MSAASQLMFIGTYTKEGSQGIYAVRLDPATGALGTPALAAATPNPTFLAWHPSQPVLYALALEKLFPDERVEAGRLYFCSSVGGFEEVPIPLDREARRAAEKAERERRWNVFEDIPWDRCNRDAPEELALCAETFFSVEAYLPDYVAQGAAPGPGQWRGPRPSVVQVWRDRA